MNSTTLINEIYSPELHTINNKIAFKGIEPVRDCKSSIRTHKVGDYIITEDFTDCIPKEEALKEIEEIKQILLYQLSGMKFR